MTDTQYHSSKRIGRSGLQLVARSPFHYWAEYLDPNRVRKEPTKALRMGTALHTAVLESDVWSEKIAVRPDRWPTKAECGLTQAEQQAEFEAVNDRKTIITADENGLVRAMYNAVMQHPTARKLLAGPGFAEKVYTFDHPETGSPAKIKPDWVSLDSNLVVDLKTTEDASPAGFSKSCFKFWYHVQAAWYLDGLYYAEGTKPKGFVFIAVEKNPPHAVAVYYAPAEMIVLGRETYLPVLRTYEECRQSGVWPGYPEDLQPINLPAWAFNN